MVHSLLPTMFAVAAGLCAGTYTNFIKNPKAMVLDPHPSVWTVYQAFWLFVFGCCFVLLRIVRGGDPAYAFSWWGVICAWFWALAAILMNANVRALGIGLGNAVEASSLAVLSFILGTCYLGNQLKDVRVAWALVVAILIGIFGMIFVASSGGKKGATEPLGEEAANLASPTPDKNWMQQLSGYLYAVVGGACATLVMGSVNIGRKVEMHANNCTDFKKCPAEVQERFDNFGSWILTSGLAGLVFALLFWALFAAIARFKGEDMIRFSFRVKDLGFSGSAGGVLISLAKVCVNSAVILGGNAVPIVIFKAVSMIIAGLWSILWYKEFGGRQALGWSLTALWTVTFMTLLSLQSK